MASIVGLNDFADALIKVGYDLVKPHSSTQELLTLLEEAESLLRTVGQDQPLSMQNALIPSKDGLVSAGLLNHPDSDIRVSVVTCLTELVRITAPDAPYDDDQMKEVFRLTVEAFEKLADLSSRSYKKLETVLDSVSRVRSCLVMLDLECYDLILQMFQSFLKIISPDHSQEVFSAMEMIMITTIDETEEVFPDLLDTLLSSVKKENETVSPMSWSLAEKVLSRCAHRLKPHIIEALKSTGTSLDMYSPVVKTICESVHDSPKVHNGVHETEELELEVEREVALRDSSEENLDSGNARKETRSKSGSKRPARDGTVRVNVNEKLRNGNSSKLLKKDAETELGVSGKRGRKPNSLMNPEDYDISWLSGKRDSGRTSSNTKVKGSGGESSRRNKRPLPKETSPATTSRALKRSRVKIDESDHDLDSLSSPRLKKLASCFRDEVTREKESSQEESDEIPEDDRKIGTSSKKTRSQNGLEKSQKKKPTVEAKVENSSGKRSSARSSAKRKSASLDTPVPQSSKSKKMVSQIAEESEESSKSHSTRRRSGRKEVESDTNEFGKDLVGKRVKIWWPLDKMYYEGVLQSYSSQKKTHLVVYLDGDSEALNLAKERWELLEEEDHNSASEEDMETDLPESVPLIDLMQRQKLKKCKSVGVSVQPTSSSGVRSSGRLVTKKGSGKKGKKQAKRGKGGSKVAAVKNLKSLKELNAKTERTEEQEVDDDTEDDDSEKQEQSEDKSEEEEEEEEECLKLTDTEAETKEEEKQSPNSEVESEREGSGSEEEPKWRETDEEAEKVADDEGTNPSSSEKEEEEEDEEKVMEDEAEEMVEDKGTNTSLSDTEKEEDEAEEREEVNGTNTNMSETEKEEGEERDMEEVDEKGTNISLSETEGKEEGEDKEMEDVADEREDVTNKVTNSKLAEIETEKEEDEEKVVEAEAEEREEMVGEKVTKSSLSETEKEEGGEKDMETEAEERGEMVDDKGTKTTNLSEIEKEGEMEDEAEDREEVDDLVSKTNLSETEKEENEKRVMEMEAEEVNETNTSLPETEKEKGEEKEMKDEAEEKEKVEDKEASTKESEIEKE